MGRFEAIGAELAVLGQVLLQAREPEEAGRVFFARYDPKATWLTELRPISPEPLRTSVNHLVAGKTSTTIRRHPAYRRQVDRIVRGDGD